MYKAYHRDVPKLFETYYIENSNIHGHVTRQIEHIHIAHADTNRRNMSMWFQGGKVWNDIVKHKIPYNENIDMFKHEYKSFLLSFYTPWLYSISFWHYTRGNIVSAGTPHVMIIVFKDG